MHLSFYPTVKMVKFSCVIPNIQLTATLKWSHVTLQPVYGVAGLLCISVATSPECHSELRLNVVINVIRITSMIL